MNPNDKNLDVHYSKTYSPISHAQDFTDIDFINVLDTEKHIIKGLQQQDA